MGTTPTPRTATIYEFPRKARAAAIGSWQGKGMADARTRAPAVDFGSGWYHEAAIREAEHPIKP
jgi:Protein of unknown function (DUF2735)